MSKRMKKLLSMGMAVMLAAGTLAGCGSSAGSSQTAATTQSAAAETGAAENAEEQAEASETTAEEAAPAENNGYVADEVKMAIQPQATLSPWGTNVAFEYNAEVYEYLFAQDSDTDLFPVLADASRGEFGGYDHEAGSGDYTVYIYDYIYDSEGNHITASDVKFSFEYQYENAPTSGWDAFESVEVVDDTTCIFHFSRELYKVGELKNVWARCVIVSEEGFNNSPSELAADMCGTGPYKLEEYSSGAQVVLVRNENYWQTNEELLAQRQRANVEKITYVFMDEAAQQIIGLQTGDLDVVPDVSSSNLVDFEEGGAYADDFNITEWLQLGVRYIMCNTSEDSLCGDVNLRQAIFYAIDNEGLAAALGAGTSVACHSLISEAFPEYDSEWETWDNYENVCDYDLSKEYLEKAGYNGETLSLMCESTYNPAAEIIQSMLLQVGIKVDINNYDRNTINSIKAESDGWDLFLDNNAGDAGATQLQHCWDVSNADGTRTENFIVDAEWQELLDELMTVEGGTKENWDAWMQRCYDNAYGMALISEVNHIVYRSNIESVVRTDKNKLMPGGFVYTE